MNGLRELAGRVRELDLARLDWLLAVVLGGASELQVWLGGSLRNRPVAAVSVLALWAAVAVRRRWPFGAVLAGGAAGSLYAASGATLFETVQGSLSPVALVLLSYGAGAFIGGRRSAVALVTGVALLLPQILLGHHVVSDLLYEPLILALPSWFCGRWVRARTEQATRFRELSEELDAGRERDVELAADLERVRIARELHDVIGHFLSVIVLQAGGARTVLRSDPQRAHDAMLVVEQAGHEALAEMQRLLEVFDIEAPGAELSPQPGLASIEELVTRTQAAGLATSLTVCGDPREVPAGFALCAYRIVQEGLTNTIKHAQAGEANVRVAWLEDRLEIEVADNGRGPVSDPGPRAGQGLVGMRERAALHRGSVRAGAGIGGGYLVQASLPLVEDGAL